MNEHVRTVDALKAVQRQTLLDDRFRAAAVALVEARGDRPSRLRERSLQIASEATRAADEYHQALALIESAGEVIPESPEYLVVRALILDRLEETAESESLLHQVHSLLAEPRWQSTSTKEFVERVEGMLHD